MNNVVELRTKNGQRLAVPPPLEHNEIGGGGSGGDPPHNNVMEARVKALKEAVKNLPTKANFAELRADIAKMFSPTVRWCG